MFKFKNAGLLGLSLLAVSLTLNAPNPAKAEVTNRLVVQTVTRTAGSTSTSTGRCGLPASPSKAARDCYPNQYGRQQVLRLEARDSSTACRGCQNAGANRPGE